MYISRWLVWSSGNGVGHINKVKLRRARLVLGLVTAFGGSTIPIFSRSLRPTQPCHHSVGTAMSICDGFGHHCGRNGEFCVAVSPATRNSGIVAQVG